MKEEKRIYTVHMAFQTVYSVDIEAESYEEAEDKAIDKARERGADGDLLDIQVE